MKQGIEEKIRKIVQDTTSVAAIEEWKIASNNQVNPLYDYRGDHVEQVVRLAKHLAQHANANMEVVTLAAWFHDYAKPGLGGISIEDHGTASAKKAKDWLLNNGFDSTTVNKICDVIRKHVGLTLKEPLEPIEAQVLWEADKIYKLGLIGLLQYILNGIRIQPGNDLNKFHEELVEFLPLAEEIANSMVTQRGKALANERLSILKYLAETLESELSPDKEE